MVPNLPSCLPCLLATMPNLPQHSTMHLSFSSARKHLLLLLLPPTTINKHTCPPSTLPMPIICNHMETHVKSEKSMWWVSLQKVVKLASYRHHSFVACGIVACGLFHCDVFPSSHIVM